MTINRRCRGQGRRSCPEPRSALGFLPSSAVGHLCHASACAGSVLTRHGGAPLLAVSIGCAHTVLSAARRGPFVGSFNWLCTHSSLSASCTHSSVTQALYPAASNYFFPPSQSLLNEVPSSRLFLAFNWWLLLSCYFFSIRSLDVIGAEASL